MVRTVTRIVVWLGVLAVVLPGGFVAIAFAGALCEDVGSAGSDAYCKHGGMETAWVAVLAALAWALLVPAAGLLFRSRGTFLFGVTMPFVAIPAVVVLALAYGTG